MLPRVRFSVGVFFIIIIFVGNTFREKEIWSYEVKLFLVTFLYFIFLTPLYTRFFFFQSIINKMGFCYLRCGICTLKSMQRETAFSLVIGFLASNSYSWKFRSVAWFAIFQFDQIVDVYACLPVSKKKVGLWRQNEDWNFQISFRR